MAINHYIANATGKLDKLVVFIDQELERAKQLAADQLGADKIDVIFVNEPRAVIPELGVGGFTYCPDRIEIRLDPTHNIKSQHIYSSLLHEFHHAVRCQKLGYNQTWGKTLGNAMFTEGLACLYEKEITGNTPIYAKQILYRKYIQKADRSINHPKDKNVDWFFGTTAIPRWFGYSYGYELAKRAARKTGKSASRLVAIPWDEIAEVITE